MDFDCEQRESVHFFYTLPYSKNKALVETTWLSKMNDDSQKDYDLQLKDYIENHLNLKDYKIIYKEEGAIPLFYPTYEKEEKNTDTPIILEQKPQNTKGTRILPYRFGTPIYNTYTNPKNPFLRRILSSETQATNIPLKQVESLFRHLQKYNFSK